MNIIRAVLTALVLIGTPALADGLVDKVNGITLDDKGQVVRFNGLTVTAAKTPGVIMDVSVDANGDLDRESFAVEVKDGKQVVKEVLPALAKK